ncbi:MAG: DUF4907 domain-containing protein [Crocinitomicaceae bacterium]|nr:DUF4907 domain-containing protein [Crocinitomicaceae bacterium]
MKFYLLFPLGFLIACSQEPSTQTTEKMQQKEDTSGKNQEIENTIVDLPESETTAPEQSSKSEEKYTYRVIHTENIGWGYEILEHESVIIKQIYIPAIQGNHAFSTEKDAQKTAEFILDKMNNNIFPPTLSKDELTYLNVLP